ncbi:MAG: class I SAM-dependent methyltransferase [Candidatus Weimeria sp.]
MSKTIDYYNENADAFVQGTVNADMTEIRNKFLSGIPAGGLILDLGCGSGRDSKAFLDAGYRVVSVDGSEELCKRAEELTGQPVICTTFANYEPEETFDGIWACASLLHLKKKSIQTVVKKLLDHLKTGGYFYMSFKLGNSGGMRNGRYFTDMDKRTIRQLFKSLYIELVEESVTGDVREGRESEQWLNELYKKSILPYYLNHHRSRVVTGIKKDNNRDII